MLFMGSARYPQQNDFSSYVQLHAGETNASTSIDGTKYYFEVSNDGFAEALDRWGQFFVSPLFDSSCVDRELNAVDSEFQLSLTDDECRVWEYDYSLLTLRIIRQASNPTSTLNRFGCGNLNTLRKPTIKEHLIEFYNTHYSANLMRLTVYSNASLDDIATQYISNAMVG